MKKITPIILLIICSSNIYAQNKPSKQETIAFIDRMVKASEGSIIEYDYDHHGSNRTIIAQEFNDRNFNLTSRDKNGDETYTRTSIHWEAFLNIETVDNPPINNAYYMAFHLEVSFSIPYHQTSSRAEDEYFKSFSLWIPKEKAESVKKAILRLVEIAKQENKDPFAN